eukprot:15350682-Ditylum_brightwellii.AAC.1
MITDGAERMSVGHYLTAKNVNTQKEADDKGEDGRCKAGIGAGTAIQPRRKICDLSPIYLSNYFDIMT